MKTMNEQLKTELLTLVNKKHSQSNWGLFHYLKDELDHPDNPPNRVRITQPDDYDGYWADRYRRYGRSTKLDFKNFKKYGNKKTLHYLGLELKDVRQWCKELGIKKSYKMKYQDCVKSIMAL